MALTDYPSTPTRPLTVPTKCAACGRGPKYYEGCSLLECPQRRTAHIFPAGIIGASKFNDDLINAEENYG